MSDSAAATGSWEANSPWKTVVFSPEGDDPAGSDEGNYQTLVPAHLLTGIDSDVCKTLVPLPVALEFSSDLSPPREGAAGESLSAQDFPEAVQEEVTFGQPVWLHVYDLTDSFQLPVLNSALRRAGAGLFHAGIEVHGYEYSFGLRQRGSGVYTSVPKENTAHAYRESFLLGNTAVDRKELKKIIKELKKEWPGRSYGPLTRNCIHFSAALSERLGVGAVPGWVYGFAESLRSIVNRLADCSQSVARIADETDCAGMVQILDAHEEVHALDLKRGSGSTMRL